MSGAKHVNEYLDRIEGDEHNRHYVSVVGGQSQPWVQRFVWVAPEVPGEPPTECPCEHDQLFIAVRNLSVSVERALFEVSCEHGRILLEKEDDDSVLREKLTAVPSTRKTAVPVEKSCKIRIEDGVRSTMEVVNVRSRLEVHGGSWEEDTLALRPSRTP